MMKQRFIDFYDLKEANSFLENNDVSVIDWQVDGGRLYIRYERNIPAEQVGFKPEKHE